MTMQTALKAQDIITGSVVLKAMGSLKPGGRVHFSVDLDRLDPSVWQFGPDMEWPLKLMVVTFAPWSSGRGVEVLSGEMLISRCGTTIPAIFTAVMHKDCDPAGPFVLPINIYHGARHSGHVTFQLTMDGAAIKAEAT